MTQTMGTLPPSFTVNARLAGHLADLAVGRSLVIGFSASRRCGVASGDFTVSWGPNEPTRGYVALRPVESVPVFVDRRLLDVLRRAELELWPGGFFSRRTPSIRLAWTGDSSRLRPASWPFASRVLTESKRRNPRRGAPRRSDDPCKRRPTPRRLRGDPPSRRTHRHSSHRPRM